jgi:23S rRNA (uracil1939-C5)-methyltransferase
MKRMNRLARARPSQAARRGRAAQASPPEERILHISAIGARGDATAPGPEGPIYAPFALPGEQVRALVTGGRAEVREVLEPSADRQAPVCRHFGRCGGCQLQHWKDDAYLTWKRGLVVEALSRRGIAAGVEATIPAWGEGRRRAAFHAARQNGQARVGFIERGGAKLTPIAQCPVLAPGLEAVALKLAPLAELVLPQRGEITLHCLLTDAGVDVAIKGAGSPNALHRAGLATPRGR